MDRRLPSRMWSASSCLSNAYPDAHFTWVNASLEQDHALGMRLGLSAMQLADYKADATRLLDAGYLGWPNVFLSLSEARAFASRWLGQLPAVRLLSLALPDELVPLVVTETTPGPGMGPSGVHLGLQRSPKLEGEAIIRGFDILGLETASGSFHSFICNDLTADFIDELGLSLNEHALIPGLEDAQRAASFVGLEETGAEPALWLPWRIGAYPLG